MAVDLSSCDFSGYVTRNNVLCSDGRTIRDGAFDHCDGRKVPLVWNHSHDNPFDVLGNVILKKRPDGMYGYAFFNGTEAGRQAHDVVQHGDIDRLSIHANHLKQRGGNVLHGEIREVSLVQHGANEGAFIDFVNLSHSDDEDAELEAYIYLDEAFELSHSEDQEEVHEEEPEEAEDEEVYEYEPEEEQSYVMDNDEEEEDDEDEDMEHADNDFKLTEEEFNKALDSLTDKQRNAVYALLGQMLDDDVEHADTEEADEEGDSINSILATLTDDQKKAVSAVFAVAIAQKNSASHSDDGSEEYYGEDDMEHSDGGDDDMKYNAFENQGQDTKQRFGDTLTHAEMDELMNDAKKSGSLKEAFLMHADEYGVENLDYLFPDAKAIEEKPDWIQRDMEWVAKVMNGAHKTPFSRIKSIHADITEDEARARGYIKGNLKKEEVFKLLKRTTEPTTIYKKQKFDKDDLRDITSFDFISWVKAEMQMMLREEAARAILIGDGRSTSDDDHIPEDHIRPIAKEPALYNTQVKITKGADAGETAKKTIDDIVRARKFYKGSGNPIFFTTEDVLTEMLLLDDGVGRRLYKSEAEVATALRVREIVPVQVMEGVRIDGLELCGIIVNMNDYNIGADKGGQTEFFDDFDLDYNQMKYLYEARFSGALTKPFSALTILYQQA